MTADELEARAINVVRALAMDAVQKANSGHPGTPMALAPLARRAVHAGHEVRRGRSRLARPRSLRALGRARVDAPLLDAVPVRARPRARRPAPVPAVGVEDARPPREGPHRRASRSRPVRSARASATRSASRSRRSTCAPGSVPSSATTTSSRSAATATSWKASATKPRRSPVTTSSASSSSSTTTTTSRSTARPSSPTPTTCPSGSARTAGTCVELGEVAEDLDALEAGLRDGMAEEDRPTLLVLRSHIGYPSPKFQDTSKAHGEPLGADEVTRVKEILGLPADQDFYVPDDVLDFYRAAGPARRLGARGVGAPAHGSGRRESRAGRGVRRSASRAAASRAGSRSCRRGSRATSLATRVASQEVLSAVFDVVPGLIGGGGDLTGNTGTLVKGAAILTPEDASGRIIHFGIREHGMGAAANGIAVSGPLPFVGTFFVFSDYMRPSVRLAAMMHAKVAFVWTHDSVGLGEDGPTHQPIEQLAALRAMPGLRLIRRRRRERGRRRVARPHRRRRPDRDHPHPPEAAGARRHGRTRADGVARGAYVLVDEDGDDRRPRAHRHRVPRCPCASARVSCSRRAGISARVVSMPSWDLFEAQPDDYRVDGAAARRADARGRGRRRASAGRGTPTTSSRSIASASPRPATSCCAKFGYTPENVAERALALLGRGHAMTQFGHPAHRVRSEPLVRQPHARARDAVGCANSSHEHGIRGVTSNPTIFEKAMATGTDYDAQLREVVGARRDRPKPPTGSSSTPTSPTRPTSCDRTTTTWDGADGFVSIEVNPDLAHDTEGTHRPGEGAVRPGSAGPTS